jgi:Ca2+-binding EF-hand superfamily protein
MGSIIFGCVPKREADYRALRRGIRAQMRRSSERSVRGILDSLAERVKGYDKNADGKVTKDELPRQLQRWFDRLDRDGDGALDDKELEALGNLFRRRRRR